MTPEPMPNKSAPRAHHADLKAHGQHRSRVSNGKDVLPDCDGRSTIARRYRDIANAILVDQGVDVSESRKQLIRRFAAASVLAEQLESKLANGQQIDVAEHALLCSTLTDSRHAWALTRCREAQLLPTIYFAARAN